MKGKARLFVLLAFGLLIVAILAWPTLTQHKGGEIDLPPIPPKGGNVALAQAIPCRDDSFEIRIFQGVVFRGHGQALVLGI